MLGNTLGSNFTIVRGSRLDPILDPILSIINQEWIQPDRVGGRGSASGLKCDRWPSP
jgi:hypothetical protein